MSQPAALYRALLREASKIAAPPLRRKLRYNARAAWEAHSAESDPLQLASLYEEARAAVRVLAWLNALPQASRGGSEWREMLP